MNAPAARAPFPLSLVPPEGRALVRRLHGSLLLLLVLMAAGFYTGRMSPAAFSAYMERWGVTVSTMARGELWRNALSTFVQSDPGLQWYTMLLVLGGTVPLEWFVGARRMLVTFVVGDWLSTALMIGALDIAAHAGSATADRVIHEASMGSSAAAHACIAAAIVLLPPRLRRFGLAAFLAVTIVLFWFQRLDDQTAHLFALAIGAAIGWFVWRPWLARKEAAVSPASAARSPAPARRSPPG